MGNVYFRNIENILLNSLGGAKKSVKIAVAWFTNEILFNSVIECLNRGVSVQLIILDDPINRNELALDFSKFISAGGKLYYSSKRKMHNKFCIIDEEIVLTGSYNWTYYAENLNWENLLETDDAEIVSLYSEEFGRIVNKLKPVETFIPISIQKLKESDLHSDYNYLCNDLSLKDQSTKNIVERVNKELLRDVKLEDKVKAQGYDKSGRIPLLKKESIPSTFKMRLVNIHIETVPPSMPNSGEKYVHAQVTSNSIRIEEFWVYIIDKEYVEEIRKYFHKCDGGILDNETPLPPIPADLYIPGIKYRFIKTTCYFKEGKVYQTYDSAGHLLPYEFKMFNLYARIGTCSRDYIGYKSLTEQYQWIVKSLFSPSAIEDIDYLESFRYPNGAYRGSIDDYYWFYEFEHDRMNNGKISQKHFDQILQYMEDHPNMFWFHWQNNTLMAYVYGRYITHKDFQLYDIDLPNKNDEIRGLNHWFVFISDSTIPINNYKGYKLLYEQLVKDIKSDNAFGIVTLAKKDYRENSLWDILLSLGFKPESQVRDHETFKPF